MSSPSNSNNSNPFGPPPAIFDNSTVSTAPQIPMVNTTNHLFPSTNFNPLNAVSSTPSTTSPIHSLRIPNNPNKSVPNASPNNDWGIPPQSQTELFKPPPPPPQHQIPQRFTPHKLLQPSHSASNLLIQRPPINYRAPPPPPHHESIVLSNNNSNVPAFNNFHHAIYGTNTKKRKRSPSSKSDRNVKRRIDGSDKFNYDRDRRNKSRSKRPRKRNQSRSRSRSNGRYRSRSRKRSRSPSRSKSRHRNKAKSYDDVDGDSDSCSASDTSYTKRKQKNTHKDTDKRSQRCKSSIRDVMVKEVNVRRPRANSLERSVMTTFNERKENEEEYNGNNEDMEEKTNAIHEKKRSMVTCSPPPKPPRPPAIPIIKESKKSELDVIDDSMEYLQNIGFTAHGFARQVYALAPLSNFGEDLVFPMSYRMSRDHHKNAFNMTEERKLLCMETEKNERMMDEVIGNVEAYINAAINDDDENSMRIMLEVNMKQSSLNTEVLEDELKDELRNIVPSIQTAVVKDVSVFRGYRYCQNQKVLFHDANNLYEAVILDRKMDCNKVPLYLVHFMNVDKLDKWIADEKISLVNDKIRFSFKYNIGDNIVCWHDNMLYEAKIGFRMITCRSSGSYIAQYMVHYHGWNKTWDEWVAETRILPSTAQNISLMNSISCKNKGILPVNNIHNINLNTMKRMDTVCDDDSDDDDTVTVTDDNTLTVPLQFNISDKKKKDKKRLKVININSNNMSTTSAVLDKINSKQALRENFLLKQRIICLENELASSEEEWKKKYRKKTKKCREFKECAKRLYSECVHGEGPRWQLIEFRDTEHRVTRDAELAELRTQINSLYLTQINVVGIQKWCGKKEIEESVLKYVTLNGEYRVEAETFINDIVVPLRDVLSKFSITSHRILALNGQHGIRVKMDIPKNTCFGQYFGGEILQNAFGKVFDGTGEEHDHNIYAFDQKIDKMELMKLREKQMKIDIESNDNNIISKSPRKQIASNYEISSDIPNKVFIIDPFIGDWKNDELLLRYVNDCRVDIDDLVPTEKDQKYYNVEFVGMKVNGWPQTYLIAKRDIKKDEELMTFYGTDFSNAIASKLEEEQKKKVRKQRIDQDILQGVKL